MAIYGFFLLQMSSVSSPSQSGDPYTYDLCTTLASDARWLALSLSLHGTGLTTIVLVPVVPPLIAPFEAV
jgi:hypothetical protein